MNRILSLSTVAAMAALVSTPVLAAPDFAKDIVPLLRDNCTKCHGADKQKGKLRLDSKGDTLKGGKSGKPGLVAGKPDESEIIRRVLLAKDDDDAMPPEGERLSAEKIKLLKEWIADGAKWPDDLVIKEEKKEGSGDTASRSSAPIKPRPPEPQLPKDFKPGAGEAAAIAALAKANVSVRPLAQNVPWTEANFRLQGTNITDKELMLVKDLPSLVELRLGTTKITDAGLEVLKNLPNLQILSLELTGITDAGLAHLKDLKNLVYLNLYGTPVTDAGLDVLHGKQHLRSLYLWQTKTTPAGVKKLQDALPLLDINTGAQLALIVSTNAPAEKKDAKPEEKKAEKKEAKAEDKKAEKKDDKKEEKK